MKQYKNRIEKSGRSLGISILICLMVLTTFAQAKILKEDQVKSAVETWVRHVTADPRPNAVIERMEEHVVDGEIIGYIAHLAGGGYCLCSTDDLLLPVYFYSPDGTYEKDNTDLQYFLEEITGRTKYYRQGLADKSPDLEPYREELLSRADYWQDLMAGRVPALVSEKAAAAAPDAMKLDLTCTWGQGSPYNDQCPVLWPGTDEHCQVGCVATAMAQIMYYWKWPNSGEGASSANHRVTITSMINAPCAKDPQIPQIIPWANLPDPPYSGMGLDWRLAWNFDEWGEIGGNLWMSGYWDATLYNQAQNLSSNLGYQNALTGLWSMATDHTYDLNYDVNFNTASYDWDLMQDVHTDLSPAAGDAEAAKLSYHAGVAVNMDYGLFSSGADPDNMAPAFEDHFRYDPDAALINVNPSMMTSEIQWLRPVALGGRDANNNGHRWVVFGYKTSTSQYWMNMGWPTNSQNVGLYTVSNIPNGFNLSQTQVMFIAPENVVRFVDNTGVGDGSPNNPHGSVNEAVNQAPDGGTLIFRAGSEHDFGSGTYTFDKSVKELTLKGENVTIRRTP